MHPFPVPSLSHIVILVLELTHAKRDFPKALNFSLVVQTVVFAVYGAVAYYFVGVGDMRSSVIRSLDGIQAHVGALLMIPATVAQGALFASVNGRMISDLFDFQKRFPSGKPLIGKQNLKRWGTWCGLLGKFRGPESCLSWLARNVANAVVIM